MTKYKKYGASKHLIINNAVDVFNVLGLHPSLWLATSAPIDSFLTDRNFLNYLDSDSNGRIICSEVMMTIRWLKDVLKNYEGIDNSSDFFKAEWLNETNEESCKILNTVKHILGISDPSENITLEMILNNKKNVEKSPVSETGIALSSAAESDQLKDYIGFVIKITGGELHPSGENGVSKNSIEKIKQLLISYIEWYKKFEDAVKEGNSELLPIANSTADAYSIYLKIRDKISEFFTISKAFKYSSNMKECSILNSTEQPENLNWKDKNLIEDFLKNSPITLPNSSNSISIVKPELINPLYLDDFNKLTGFIKQMPDCSNIAELDELLWRKFESSLMPYAKWKSENPSVNMDSFSIDLLKSYSESSLDSEVFDLIDKSDEIARQLNNIRLLEKLVLCQKNITDFLNNFVSFPYLYNTGTKALFEKGFLVIDGRQMNFSITVFNKNDHIKIAKSSNLFVLYVEIKPSVNKSEIVAIPVTNGVKGNLQIGKRGIFTDVKGVQSDAIVIDIIENPISLRETLYYPFQKLNSLVMSKFDSMTKESDKTFTQLSTDALDGKPALGTDKNALQNKGFSFSGINPLTILMGGGVAVAALGSSITYMATKLASVSSIKILIAIFCIILVLLAPAVIISFIKLKRRDLSSLLEASGWAINGRMTLTGKLCKVFTQKQYWPLSIRRKWF